MEMMTKIFYFLLFTSIYMQNLKKERKIQNFLSSGKERKKAIIEVCNLQYNNFLTKKFVVQA